MTCSTKSGPAHLNKSFAIPERTGQRSYLYVKTSGEVDVVGVYVIGSIANDLPVKVGYSKKVEARLSGLQSGIWFPLRVLKVRYVESQHMARKVEKEAHRILSAAGKALMGEWFDVTPEKALEAIEWAALTLGIELHEPGIREPRKEPPRPTYVRPPPPTEEELAAASRARQKRKEATGRY